MAIISAQYWILKKTSVCLPFFNFLMYPKNGHYGNCCLQKRNGPNSPFQWAPLPRKLIRVSKETRGRVWSKVGGSFLESSLSRVFLLLLVFSPEENWGIYQVYPISSLHWFTPEAPGSRGSSACGPPLQQELKEDPWSRRQEPMEVLRGAAVKFDLSELF